MTTIIHSICQYWFTVLDPLLTVLGFTTIIINPHSMLESLTARPQLPPLPETAILMIAIVGFYMCLLIIHCWVLRPRPTDIGLWKSVQAGQTIVEATKLSGVLVNIAAGAGVSPPVQVNIGITSGWILFRLAFLLGIGAVTKKKVA